MNAVAFSPDGKTLATGGDDRTVRLWDIATGRQLARLEGHSAAVRALTFRPTGLVLASGGSDSARVWDLTTNREARVIRESVCRCLAISPDGEHLATGYLDLQVRLWDLTTDGGPRHLKEAPPTFGEDDEEDWPQFAAFSPDGARVAAIVGDRVSVWDGASGENLATLGPGHSLHSLSIAALRDEITPSSLAFTQEGKLVVLGTNGEAVEVWEAKPTWWLRVRLPEVSHDLHVWILGSLPLLGLASYSLIMWQLSCVRMSRSAREGQA